MTTNQICIIEDNDIITNLLRFTIQEKCNIEPLCFANVEDLLKYPELNKIDIFIMDCNLNHELNAINLTGLLLQKQIVKTSFFIYISGSPMYDFNSFQHLGVYYDFFPKPISTTMFTNKLKMFLKFKDDFTKLETEKNKIESRLADFFNFSNLFVLMIDLNLKIKIMNDHLAKSLGYNSKNEALDQDFKVHIPKNIMSVSTHVINGIIKDKDKTKFVESTNDIQTLSGEIISVRWFNSYVNTTSDYVFSVGVPMQQVETAETIDELRNRWRNLVEKDGYIIETFRDILKRGSDC